MTRDGTHYYGDDCPGGHLKPVEYFREEINDWGIHNFGKSYSEIVTDLSDVDELRAEVEQLHEEKERYRLLIIRERDPYREALVDALAWLNKSNESAAERVSRAAATIWPVLKENE